MHPETAEKVDDKEYDIWLGRRMKEIMEAKKIKNLSEMERCTGIGRKTLERIKIGRKIEFEELEPICSYLEISVDRFLCDDTMELRNELEQLIHEHNLRKALDLAKKYSTIVIGYSEKSEAEMIIGEIYMGLNEMKTSREKLEKAFELAKKSDDMRLLEKAYDKLLKYYFYNKDFLAMHKMLLEVMNNYDLGTTRRGEMHHYLGMCMYYLGYEVDASNNFEKAIEFYRNDPKNRLNIARLQTSVAEIEFKNGNIEKAKNLLLQAFDAQKDDRLSNYLLTHKDLAKCLYHTNETNEAMTIIRMAYSIIEENNIDLENVLDDLRFIESCIDGNIDGALELFRKNGVSENLKIDISLFLVDKFIEGGDIPRDIVKQSQKLIKSQCGVGKNIYKGD